MADFAFQPYGGKSADADDDILKSRGEAEKLRRHLRTNGHDAHVERSGDGHRVWIQHPEHKDTAAYVSRGDAAKAKSGTLSPYWIRK